MQIKIDIPLNEEDIRRDILARCKKETERTLTNNIAQLFMPRGLFGQSEGALHLIVRNRLEDYLMSDQFNVQLDQWIQERIGAALDEAGDKILSWAVRKKLFIALEDGLKGPSTPDSVDVVPERP